MLYINKTTEMGLGCKRLNMWDLKSEVEILILIFKENDSGVKYI